jgi:hypothetical protein
MKPVLFLGLAVVIAANGCNRTSHAPPSSSAAPPKPVATLSSDQLVAEYQKNALGADQKYKGQLLELSGKVGKIGKGLLGDPYVSLGTASEEDLFGVACYLTPTAAEEAAKMQPGTAVKVRGVCMGQLAGQALRMQDCEFVK